MGQIQNESVMLIIPRNLQAEIHMNAWHYICNIVSLSQFMRSQIEIDWMIIWYLIRTCNESIPQQEKSLSLQSQVHNVHRKKNNKKDIRYLRAY